MNKKNAKVNMFPAWFNKLFKEKDERTALLQNIREAQRKGVINLDALMMIEGVFQVSEIGRAHV